MQSAPILDHLLSDNDEWLFCTNPTVVIERGKLRELKELLLFLCTKKTEENKERVMNLMKTIE